MKSHIPNTITLLNLLSGCIGITLAFDGELELAAIMIGIAAVFDFFDGMAARLLHVKSDIGKELDSLADVVSFGVLPGFLLYFLMIKANNTPIFSLGSFNLFVFISFILPLFSALRLAKFNIDVRQTESFLGLPTPAVAMCIASFPLMLGWDGSVSALTQQLLGNYYVLAVITLASSLLLVSEIPLISLKFKSLKWKDNQKRFILIFISILIIPIFQFSSLPLIILIYILISLIPDFRRSS
ncbi:MAG: CDP-diacylglycerol--serine O-phosphatidyltransferase [Bacteroidales bacterium]|nr:CDP-diacylglycerol--serine O-phosphatidyltransferase [Bacteroidales bacterium]